jgi:hypothetical protein
MRPWGDHPTDTDRKPRLSEMSQDEQPPGDHAATPARTPMAPMETFERSAARSMPCRHHTWDHSAGEESCPFTTDPISLGL